MSEFMPRPENVCSRCGDTLRWRSVATGKFCEDIDPERPSLHTGCAIATALEAAERIALEDRFLRQTAWLDVDDAIVDAEIEAAKLGGDTWLRSRLAQRRVLLARRANAKPDRPWCSLASLRALYDRLCADAAAGFITGTDERRGTPLMGGLTHAEVAAVVGRELERFRKAA